MDNDGLHGMREYFGRAALKAGLQAATVLFFERTVYDDVRVYYDGPAIGRRRIPPRASYHADKQ